MPFVRPGEEPPKRDRHEPPLITEDMRIGWILKDAERFGGRPLSRDEKLNIVVRFVKLRRG